MASPQVENGHVDIANEIVEALAHIRLSGEEMQVLWVIFRKTYGWHKKQDAIPLSQFSQMTGLTRIHVLRAINKLLPKKVICVTKNGNNQPNAYEFNKDFDEWVVLPKKVTVTKKGNEVLPKMAIKVLPKKVHSKETAKEIILPDSSPAKNLFEYWNSLHLISHRSFDKFKPHINAALKLFTEEEIGEAMENYKNITTSQDHFFDYRWSLDDFLSRKGGLEKFITANNPFENFKKGAGNDRR